MAIIETSCSCGEKVTVLTGTDSSNRLRRDGKRVIYTNGSSYSADVVYDVFRCRRCLNLIAETCSEAAYE